MEKKSQNILHFLICQMLVMFHTLKHIEVKVCLFQYFVISKERNIILMKNGQSVE